MRIWRMNLRRTKSAKISWVGSFVPVLMWKSQGHCSASLGRPWDAEQWPSWQVVLSIENSHEIFLEYIVTTDDESTVTRANISQTTDPVRNNWASSQENLSLGFPTKWGSNRPAQLQRLARGLKFWIYKLEVLYYLGSEQQRCWSDAQADLFHCCSHVA